MIKVIKKVNGDKYFDTERVYLTAAIVNDDLSLLYS